MSTQTVPMGRKKQKSGNEQKPDLEQYRKPFRNARIRMLLAEVAEARSLELAQDFTQYVNDAVRMRLEQEGWWPPKK